MKNRQGDAWLTCGIPYTSRASPFLTVAVLLLTVFVPAKADQPSPSFFAVSASTTGLPSHMFNNTQVGNAATAASNTGSGVWEWVIIGLAALFVFAFVIMCWQLRRLQLENNRLLARRALMLEAVAATRDLATGLPLQRQIVLAKSELEAFPLRTFSKGDDSATDVAKVVVEDPTIEVEAEASEQPSKILFRVNHSCPICLDDFVDGETEVRVLPCSHVYHIYCIDEWLTTRSTLCPMCKHNCSNLFVDPHCVLTPPVGAVATVTVPSPPAVDVAPSEAPSRQRQWRDAVEMFLSTNTQSRRGLWRSWGGRIGRSGRNRNGDVEMEGSGS